MRIKKHGAPQLKAGQPRRKPPASAKVDAASVARAERRRQALELRLAGATHAQIAKQLGYADKGSAWVDIQRALKERRAECHEAAQDVLDYEIARIDEMLARARRVLAPLEKALREGDVDAKLANAIARQHDSILHMQERRARYLGLDAPPKTEATVDFGPETLSAFLAGSFAKVEPPEQRRHSKPDAQSGPAIAYPTWQESSEAPKANGKAPKSGAS
jgi:hypothetical protein